MGGSWGPGFAALAVAGTIGLVAGCGAAAPSAVSGSAPESAPASSAARLQTGAPAGAAAGPASGTYTVVGPLSTASYTAHETFLQHNLPHAPVGKTASVSGTLVLKNGRFLPSTVTVDLRTLRTHTAMRDRRVQAALDTARYPDAVFRIGGAAGGAALVRTGGAATLRLPGKLTIDGVTRPVVWDAQIRDGGNTLKLTAATTVQMPAFGITPPSIPGFVAVKPALELGAALTARAGGA